MCALLTTVCGYASTWAGADGNWNSNSSTGWNGTGVPNAMGSVATFISTTAARTTTQNISGGVTVGTLSFTGNQAGSRTITLTNPIIFNLDGAGTGTAVLENTNTSTSANNFLQIGSSTSQSITLADNLRITNAAGAGTNGSVYILAAVNGTGNITFNNLNSGITQAGSIRMGSAANAFIGSVLIQKGTVVSSATSKSLGDTANAVTLGQSGYGNANFLTTANGSNVQNSITVAAGSGGTLTLGKLSTGAATFSGPILLNGNLNIYSEVSNAAGLDFTGVISGTGGITQAAGTTTATGIVKLSAANTFSGTTNLGSPAVGTLSTLQLANSLALQNSTLNYFGTSKLVFSSTVGSKAFTLGGLTGASNIALQDNAGTPAAIALSIGQNNSNTTYSGKLTGPGSLTKVGTGTLTLTGANTFTGITSANAGTLLIGTAGVGSIQSAVEINSGGTLGGSGTIDGSITAKSGGTLTGEGTSGILTGNSDITLAPNSTFSWNLSSQTTSGRGINYNAVNVGGDFAVSDAYFKIIITGLDLDATFWDTTQSWQVFNKGLTTGSGFNSFQLYNQIDLNNPVNYSSYGDFTFNAGSGALEWNVIPEPNTIALLGLTLGFLLFKRRRR